MGSTGGCAGVSGVLSFGGSGTGCGAGWETDGTLAGGAAGDADGCVTGGCGAGGVDAGGCDGVVAWGGGGVTGGALGGGGICAAGVDDAGGTDGDEGCGVEVAESGAEPGFESDPAMTPEACACAS